jgi:oligopeptide transport system substrate-binding protein
MTELTTDTDVITDTGDSFTRAAVRQLVLLALGALGLLIGLMLLLGWFSQVTAGGITSGDAVDAANKSITLVIAQEPPQLDSTRATDQVSSYVLGHVVEGLLRYDAQNHLVPGVAERWDLRADGATFYLRDNAKWSDGVPVTAHDFVFAWQRVVDPANASEYAFIMFAIKNAEAINNEEAPLESLGVRAVSDYELEITYERPLAYFDKLVAFASFLPVREDFYRSRNGRYGADKEDLLYNGPFRITRWVHGAHLRFEKNDLYWDKANIALETIDLPYFTSDANAALNLYKDGKVATAGLDAESLENAMEHRWHIQRFNTGSVFFTEFNHRPGRLTRNYHLRKAMQLVNDPGELVYRVIKIPGYMPGVSLFPPWLRGVDGYFRQEYPPAPLRIDPVEARKELELARQELGVDEIPPLVILTGDTPLSVKQAEYYQALYQRTLGLDVRVDKQIFKQRLAKMTSGEFDLVLAGWGPDYDDPLTFADLFSSWNKNNRGRYSNPELDKWVRVAQSSLDPKVRMEAFANVQRIIDEDAVILHNYEQGTVYVRDPRLAGVVRRAVGTDPDYSRAHIVDG